jgi:hypothetical protein
VRERWVDQGEAAATLFVLIPDNLRGVSGLFGALPVDEQRTVGMKPLAFTLHIGFSTIC